MLTRDTNNVNPLAMNTLTVPDIINAFGGNAAFGRAIGIKPSAASEMKRRGNIPVTYWPAIVKADPIDRPRFTYDDLVMAHCSKEAKTPIQRDHCTAG